MNDYLLERYSKNDIREFWSTLLTQKKEWVQQLEQTQNEMQKASLEGAISSITFCMMEIEKKFDLF